ncbi:GntR family transcriptional regulator [Sinanaerobacter chloroacetimidivorans]|jgi:DNA-binding GntR family transcriptional regulator|uniref:GntR family transcriptional regulator n=1 Tax=Sinanaerobacter chloroacetimidivorans TaxID=2818044 RepID=A0A8J7W1R0_9FIRM|nr:GntR family transcriptional regulator [Sinanaerobacter chloroacetimidivorans]MBR0599237.1 GntR family transcriptional regulator [Sinanaerobacter chloroacetimidivorans]
MLNFDIQSHRPLREIVYEELRSLILTGKIKPGTRMMEIELAEDMGVSRTPIREAIRKLEKEGLVVIEPRKGAYASEVSLKDMEDILEVRANLEGLAAYLAAERMTAEQKKELLSVSEKFHQAVLDSDVAEMIRNDSIFHHLIVESSRNNHLIHMVEQMQELVLRFRYIYYKDFKRAEEMIPEHQRIYEEITNGNGANARFEAFNHIDKLKDMIMKDDSFK